MSPVLILCAALAFAGWWALLRRTPGGLGGRVFAAEWRTGENLFAAFLGSYFLLLIVAGNGPAAPLTVDVIRGGVAIYALVLGTLLSVLFARGFSPAETFGLRPARPVRAIALGVVCFAATYPVVLAVESLTAALGYSVSESDEMVQFLRGPISAGDRAWVVVMAVIAAPLAEEFVFRGFLYGVLKKHFGPLAAMGTSALLFAAIHQNIPAIPTLAALAIGFTLAYELTGSLWTPIVMHVIFNSISVVVIFFFPEWANNV